MVLDKPKIKSMGNIKIGIIGLGYVGLPLARLFATKYPVVGFDAQKARVEELMKGHDSTLEVDDQTLCSVLKKKIPSEKENRLYCSDKSGRLERLQLLHYLCSNSCRQTHSPDLLPLYKASETVATVN